MNRIKLISLVALFGAVTLTISLSYYLYQAYSDIKSLESSYFTKNPESVGYKFEPKRPRMWVESSDVSKMAKAAIIVSEDWAFYEHKGVDFNQLSVVLNEFFEEGKLTRGASTISQQVCKNLFLTNDRSLIRKLQEYIYTYFLEKRFSKSQILTFYLNLIELGDNLFGIEQASNKYFQKSSRKLNAREGAFLAMLLPSPKRYSESVRKNRLTPFATEQIDNILIKMRQAKYISEEQRAEASSKLLSFEIINYVDSEKLDISHESYDSKELLPKEIIPGLR